MKHTNSKFEYEQQRDENLLRVYRSLLGASSLQNMEDIYRRAVMTPCERFWVSEERALAVVSRMAKDYNGSLHQMWPLKRKMYKEIYKRTQKLMEQGYSRAEAVFAVVAQPAPEFYLTPGSAKVILCRMKKKKWYLERKRKLRHLF